MTNNEECFHFLQVAIMIKYNEIREGIFLIYIFFEFLIPYKLGLGLKPCDFPIIIFLQSIEDPVMHSIWSSLPEFH